MRSAGGRARTADISYGARRRIPELCFAVPYICFELQHGRARAADISYGARCRTPVLCFVVPSNGYAESGRQGTHG